MVNISKQNGIKNGGHVCKTQRIERDNYPGIAVWVRTDSGNRGPEDAAETKRSYVRPASEQRSKQQSGELLYGIWRRKDLTRQTFFRRQGMMLSKSLQPR
jgi:hypothetical protein